GDERGLGAENDRIGEVGQTLCDHPRGLAVPDGGDGRMADVDTAQPELLDLLVEGRGGQGAVPPEGVLEAGTVLVGPQVGVVGAVAAGAAFAPDDAPCQTVGGLRLSDTLVVAHLAKCAALAAQGREILLHSSSPSQASMRRMEAVREPVR